MRDKTRIAELLQATGKQQIAIAELEAIGLPLRIINLLEEYLGVIWLEDLLMFTPAELKEQVPNLGGKSLKEILDCLEHLEKLLTQAQEVERRSVPLIFGLKNATQINADVSG